MTSFTATGNGGPGSPYVAGTGRSASGYASGPGTIYQTSIGFAGNNLIASVLYSISSEGYQYWANGSLGEYASPDGSATGTVSRDDASFTVYASWSTNYSIPATGGVNTNIWIDNILSNQFAGVAVGVTVAPTPTSQITSLSGHTSTAINYIVPPGGYLKIEW